ncbi:hypothetical protein BV898_02655 [Hypsibius exemplaris]|uniref:Uncharacterized protein n=1 Tax=Hypsibius exemplaris TaxID=2072580 RepID=A0A1W0X804_HYPEX|nr:hypothetical protein BV898_02655 [Hypsibius exemplaris]
MPILHLLSSSFNTYRIKYRTNQYGQPQTVLSTSKHWTDEYESDQVLLLPGIAQVLLGFIAWMALIIYAEESFLSFTIASLWLVGSGLTAFHGTFFTRLTFYELTGPESRVRNYQRLSFYVLLAYQFIVLIGIVISMYAAVDGFGVVLTHPWVTRKAVFYLNSEGIKLYNDDLLGANPLETANAGAAAVLIALILTGCQIGIFLVIQRTLTRSYRALLTNRRNRSPERTVVPSCPGSGRDEDTAAQHAQYLEQYALLHAYPPSMSVGSRPSYSSRTVDDTRGSTSTLTLGMEDLPPRYSTVGLPAECVVNGMVQTSTMSISTESLPPYELALEIGNSKGWDSLSV